mmetsp:Transcript_12858/g.20825  ORF Transcript_12858/g.20825 Transcript_12858/m.20825 type:complete len:209 (-) Transcript_12858:230-856(-)
MTKRILAECNLKAATSACLTFHTDISSADNDCAARGEIPLSEALDTCVGLGGKIMCGNMYSALGKYDAPPTTQGRANAVAALKRVARRAADMGVTLGLEVLNRYETNLLNTAEQAMEFLAEVDEANVKVHLDSYHMNIEERSLRQAVLTCGDKLGYVHVGESHRGQLGTGNVDFVQLFWGLAEINYTGACGKIARCWRWARRTTSSRG